MTDKDYPFSVFVSYFTGNEPFLTDHIINGRKILPGVVYLEMSRAAVALATDINEKSNSIQLSDSFFLLPMIVNEKCKVEISVYPGAKGEFGIEVQTEQGIHFQSKARVIEKTMNSGNVHQLAVIDLLALEQKCTTIGPAGQEFYDNFKKKGINLGSSLRGIKSIKKGTDCALVNAIIPGSSNLGIMLSPGIFDSFIQSCDVLADDQERVRLPYGVMKTEIFGELKDQMYGFLEKSEKGIDIIIFDDKGEIKVRITDFIGRELESQDDQLVFYKPVLQYEQSEFIAEKAISIIQGKKDYFELVKSLLTTSKKLIADKIDNHTIEVVLSEDKPAWQGAVAALKTITLEYPKIKYRVKYGDKYLSTQYNPVNTNTVPAYKWPDNRIILISGGLGGIGKIIAKDIAEKSKGCKLILVGRSELTEDKMEFIKYIESLGTFVEYISCDITKKNEVDSLFSKYSHIDGIIHGAGINRDNLIIKKNEDDVIKVLAPKVSGVDYLDQASSKMKLDYFIALSSIAGTLGNAGQIDYSAANGYMDTFIKNRNQMVKDNKRSGKSISINWPLWESDGMQIDDETKRNLFKVFKVKPMPAASGLEALKKIIAGDNEQVIVLYGNPKAIESMFSKPEPAIQKIQKQKPHYDSEVLAKQLLHEVRNLTAEYLKRPVQELDDNLDWANFGLDSILLSGFVNKINSYFNLNLMPPVLFEATNINLLSSFLAENFSEMLAERYVPGNKEKKDESKADGSAEPEKVRLSPFAQNLKKAYKSTITYREKDVAVVGISCRIAGARNLDEFWNVLDKEMCMVKEIPSDRWDWRDYPGVVKWGSFIDGVDEFDPLFFGISPAEAIYMAPEQRLLMQYVWECMENAGYGIDELKGSNTGLFVGYGTSGYTHFLKNLPIEAYSAAGMVPSIGPNRISYYMDWHGPSNPIDTACSSALVAVHQAVQAIRSGQIDQAFVGGVNLILSPDVYISFTKSGMLSEDGKCKTFSDKANGYVRGEGVGILMLKPLKSAIRDGNVIYAVVKGTAVNHGGRTNSMTAPNPKAQADVIKKAIEDSGLDFKRINYIECHGTGTPLGDPVEIRGLKSVEADLLSEDSEKHICKIGSIKTNIGHLEIAAGIAGLIKVILQMKNKKIAKSLHCDKINPYIDLSSSSFEIAQNASEWLVPAGQTRAAGVSSFGFGGVNAHVVLEEYQEVNYSSHNTTDKPKTQLIVFSAFNEENLIKYVAQYTDFLSSMTDGPELLKQIAYTLQMGRTEMQERLVFIVNSVSELSEMIKSFVSSNGKQISDKIIRGSAKTKGAEKTEFVEMQTGREHFRKLVDDNEYQKIAELWVNGKTIDWKSLQHEQVI